MQEEYGLGELGDSANQQFILVRGEAEEMVKMSMFQSIVSIVRMVGLWR